MKAVTLADMGTIFDGPHATPTRRDQGPYFLNIASLQQGRLDLRQSDHVDEEDFNKWTRRVSPQEGDLLFSYETRLGDAAMMPSGVRACLGRRMALLRPNRATVHPRYLLYRYLSPDFNELIRAKAIHGATVDRIALSTMGAWPIAIHELGEQRAIAEVLGALDDKNAANLLLERAADDLIAAYAERVGLAAVESVSFLTAVDVTFGAAFKGALFAPPAEGRPLIRIRDLKTHTPQTWTTEERRDETVIVPGDVVVGMDADFEPAWWLGEPALLNQRVMRVSCDAWGSALTRYLVTPPLRQIQSSKTGTTVAHLNKSDLATLELPRLPQENVAAVREIVDPLLARRVASAQERARLGSLRDVLLPELMSGRLRVKDAEKTVEEVV